MSSTAEKSDDYDFFKFAMGDGLVTAPLKVWKVTRRHINPLFHPRNLEHMIPAFNRNARELVTVLSAHVGGAPINVFHHTMDTSLQTACHLIFGSDLKFNIESEEFEALRKIVERISQITMDRTSSVWLRVEPVFKLFYKRELREMNEIWSRFTEETLRFNDRLGHLPNSPGLLFIMLNKRPRLYTTEPWNLMVLLNLERVSKRMQSRQRPTAKITLTENKNTLHKRSNETHLTQEPNLENNVERLNFLDVYKLLQKNYPNFSDKCFLDEVVTLYGTGTDTVGQLTASCLLALAYHPDIQEKLFQEILSVVGKDIDIISQDLLNMPYLDRVYKESHRFFTIVPFVGRKTTEEIQLGKHFIPAGCTVACALGALNMNPKVYSNPKEFDPEHFSPESAEGREKYSFIPFSAGPRNCIGKRYAEMLVKILVVHTLRRYKLSTKMDIYNMKKKLTATLVCTEGYYVSLETRN